MEFSFWKYHGLGNDFLLVDEREQSQEWDVATVQAICDRHRGVGGDGILLARSSEVADFQMIIWNADGSRPEMCGNGLRCFAKYLHDQGMTTGTSVDVETDRGVLRCELTLDEAGVCTTVRVDMGAPIFERELIPMLGDGGRVLEEAFECEGEELVVSAVSMGNPHLITFRPFGAREDELAPILESHPRFPQRTNVEFVEQLGDSIFNVVVYERGCGYTQACGTGACAVGVVAVLTGRAEADKELEVRLPGGPLWIEVPSDFSMVWMRGPATRVFSGNWVG